MLPYTIAKFRNSYFAVAKVLCDFNDFGNASLSLFQDVYNFGGVIIEPLAAVRSLIGTFLTYRIVLYHHGTIKRSHRLKSPHPTNPEFMIGL